MMYRATYVSSKTDLLHSDVQNMGEEQLSAAVSDRLDRILSVLDSGTAPFLSCPPLFALVSA